MACAGGLPFVNLGLPSVRLFEYRLPYDPNTGEHQNAVSFNQVECHFGNVPAETIQYGRAHGVAITAYSPLAKGAVNKQKQVKLIAERYGCSTAQVALRWLTQQGIAMIPKTSSRERLAENFASAALTLSDQDIDLLSRI